MSVFLCHTCPPSGLTLEGVCVCVCVCVCARARGRAQERVPTDMPAFPFLLVEKHEGR